MAVKFRAHAVAFAKTSLRPQRAPATSTGMAAAGRQAAGPAPKDAPAAPGSKAQAEAALPLEFLLRFLQLRAQVCSAMCKCEEVYDRFSSLNEPPHHYKGSARSEAFVSLYICSHAHPQSNSI